MPQFVPGASREGSTLLQNKRYESMEGMPYSPHPLEMLERVEPEVEVDSQPIPLSSPQGHGVAPMSYEQPIEGHGFPTGASRQGVSPARAAKPLTHAARPVPAMTYRQATAAGVNAEHRPAPRATGAFSPSRTPQIAQPRSPPTQPVHQPRPLPVDAYRSVAPANNGYIRR